MANETKLLFAYDALLDPDTLFGVAPSAEFLLVAHYPETRLEFVSTTGGPRPTLVKDPGHTVWGGVFRIPPEEMEALVAMAAEEGRSPGYQDQRAVDREGNKHDCVVFVAEGEPASAEPAYVEAMIRGARHWQLPAGWVIGLEDLVDDPLFT